MAEYLHSEWSDGATFDEPRLTDTLVPRGILAIRRETIQDAILVPDDHGLRFDLQPSEDDIERIEQMLERGIQPAVGFIVIASNCKKCGAPYEECGCSKLIDEGVTREITEAWPLSFWTDRPLV